jgi:hypothetical protein
MNDGKSMSESGESKFIGMIEKLMRDDKLLSELLTGMKVFFPGCNYENFYD